MIPHYLNGDLLVAIDFGEPREDRPEGGVPMILVADLYRKGEAKSGHSRYVRLRYEGGQCWRDLPTRHGPKCPAIDAESWHWQPDRTPLGRLRVDPDEARVVVDRRGLLSVLERFAKLTSKSLAETGLLTLSVYAGGVSLVSHGEDTLVASVEHVAKEPARDGFGTVVVCAELLRVTCKELSQERLAIAASPRAPGRRLHVGFADLWTVDAAPRSAVVPEPVSYGITPAIARALVFASTDEARPNLNCVAIIGRGDHACIEATNGHMLYREIVTGPVVAEVEKRTYTLPRSVLATLRPRKRGGDFRFAFGVSIVDVACEGLQVRCHPGGHTFPPSDQLVPAWVHRLARGEDVIDTPGYEVHVLPREQVNAFAAWLKKHATDDDTITVQFGREPFGLQAFTRDTPAVQFGRESFEPVTWTTREQSAYNCLRGFRAEYLSNTLAALADATVIRWALPDGSALDPITLVGENKLTIIKPTKV